MGSGWIETSPTRSVIERGQSEQTICLQKVAWDKTAEMVLFRWTATIPIDAIYNHDEQDKPVTRIISKILVDRNESNNVVLGAPRETEIAEV